MSHIWLSTGGTPSEGQIELEIDLIAYVLQFQINNMHSRRHGYVIYEKIEAVKWFSLSSLSHPLSSHTTNISLSIKGRSEASSVWSLLSSHPHCSPAWLHSIFLINTFLNESFAFWLSVSFIVICQHPLRQKCPKNNLECHDYLHTTTLNICIPYV